VQQGIEPYNPGITASHLPLILRTIESNEFTIINEWLSRFHAALFVMRPNITRG